MTRIIKKRWVWDEKYNSTKYKLGMNVEELITNGELISYEEKPYEYTSKSGFPWVIKVSNKYSIESIFFRESFFNFCCNDLWNLEVAEFIKQIDKILKPLNYNENHISDSFYVVFRGGFIAIAGIKRQKEKSNE